ncbi:MAG: DAK2 domain-containing protein, partial [Acutalibacteraceae bacterium]
MPVTELDSAQFANMLRGGYENLKQNAARINDLNVFPIPDGDTGSNMQMTFEGGIKALDGNSFDSLGGVSRSVAKGMLLSARGNSGVILSQLFEGIAKGFKDLETANINEIGSAFKCGVRQAYDAVLTPTEGTILTVSREAADYACSRINDGCTLESFMNDYAAEMKRSLERTPELLNVLKEAGVVDSGGAGLVAITEGMISSLSGDNISETQISDTHSATSAPDLDLFTEDSVMKFGYCTEFLLRLQKCKTDIKSFELSTIKGYLETVGNSIVALQNGTIVKVHVHTMEPGKVLNYCQQFGEFLTLKIENMSLQHNGVKAAEEHKSDDIKPAPEKSDRKKFGIVAVASGDGLKNTFSEFGADVVIDGGQTMNPSSDDFIKAFDKVNAEVCFVFPDNSNIILAARQAAELYKDSEIRVIESKNIGEGYAALSMIDFTSGDKDVIEQNFKDAMTGITTGMISRSVRDARIGKVDVKKDQFIG